MHERQVHARPRDVGEGLVSSSSVKVHSAHITIQHWQLRDLVHCPESNSVYSVNRSRLFRHDLVDNTSTVEVELGFEPTSFTASAGIIAAGGQSSQLDVRRLSFQPNAPSSSEVEGIYKGHCGGSVNNALRIARDASYQYRLFVCNNDDTIKIYSLAAGAMITMVRCPVAINYCALSPDGKTLVAVGDNRNVYLYQATSNGYRHTKTYTEACDAGMCCAWNPAGTCFAAASQDGLAVVWDHRSGDVVARYITPLACRNIKFSPSPLDLLAFAEHRGRCHVADMRMPDKEQILHVGGAPELEPDISGMTFSPCGRSLFVGTEESLLEFNVDTAARRSFAYAEVC